MESLVQPVLPLSVLQVITTDQLSPQEIKNININNENTIVCLTRKFPEIGWIFHKLLLFLERTT